VFALFAERNRRFAGDVAEHILDLPYALGKIAGDSLEDALLGAGVWKNVWKVPQDLRCWKAAGDRRKSEYVSFVLMCPSLVAAKEKALKEQEAEYRLRHDPFAEEYAAWCKEQYELEKERLRQSKQWRRLAILVWKFEGGNIQRRPRNLRGKIFTIVSGRTFVKKFF
jgi:hypothetical protein